MSRYNKVTHFYSTRELDKVLGEIDYDINMRKVIAHLKRIYTQFSDEAVRSVGTELGLSSAATAVLNALQENRSKSVTVANDDDVLTVGQLRAAVKEVARGFAQGRWVTEGGADDFVDQVMEKVNHPWKGGDIVRDANGGMFRKRHADDKWEAFGTATRYDHEFPTRPLTKVN